jgi:hypothetical protein
MQCTRCFFEPQLSDHRNLVVFVVIAQMSAASPLPDVSWNTVTDADYV